MENLTPNCRVVIDGNTYTLVDTEKRGRWDYAIVKDAKGKTHEFTVGKIEQVLDPLPESKKEVPVTQETAPQTEKAPKTPKEPKEPRVRKDTSNDPMAQGFAKFRAQHPASKDDRLGRVVQHKGDDIAVRLTDEMAENGGDIWACPLVRENLDVAKLQEKYAKLNPGMVRMNIANLLRGLDGKKAKAEEQAKKAEERKAKLEQQKADRDAQKAVKEEEKAKAKAEKEAAKAKDEAKGDAPKGEGIFE